MGRSEGTVTCPVHKKKLLVHCRCLHPYGHGVVGKWLCPHCGDEVQWTKNWTDEKRKPYHHASGACRAKSSLVEAEVINGILAPYHHTDFAPFAVSGGGIDVTITFLRVRDLGFSLPRLEKCCLQVQPQGR